MKKKTLFDALTEYFKSPTGKTIIQEAINKAMIREMTFQKSRDEAGNPIVPPLIESQEVNVIDQLVVYLSRQEGAFQGLQNKMIDHQEGVNHIASIMHEDQQRVIQAFEMVAKVIRQLDAPKTLKKIA